MSVKEYLLNYKNGKIKKGLDVGLVQLDDRLRYKQGQFNIINGFDNVGKTFWIMWYFLCLSVKHNIRFTIWSGENKDGMLTRVLMEMYVGKKLTEFTDQEIYRYQLEIENWFYFIRNEKMYTNKELYKLAEEQERDCLLIDPFTGLDRDYTHAANYNFLNETREFCNKTGMTVYVNTHPHSEAARRVYTSGEESGYQMPPSKSQTEGGQPFANRVDDFITIHRLVGHPQYGFNTHLYIRKVKDTETGGKVSAYDDPLSFEWNNGLGFTCGGYNPLQKKIEVKQPELKPITPNTAFQPKDSPFV